MDSSQIQRNCIRFKRAMRVRQSLHGDKERPRMTIFKSSKHLYVQLIDDEEAVTLVSTSTLSKEFKKSDYNRKNKVSAKQLGLKMAQLAQEKNIKSVVFDRGRFKYHGNVKEIAEGAREGGLLF